MHRWTTVAAVFPIRKHCKEPARQCTVYPTLIANSSRIEVILTGSGTGKSRGFHGATGKDSYLPAERLTYGTGRSRVKLSAGWDHCASLEVQ
jgi:hypothetical protein